MQNEQNGSTQNEENDTQTQNDNSQNDNTQNAQNNNRQNTQNGIQSEQNGSTHITQNDNYSNNEKTISTKSICYRLWKYFSDFWNIVDVLSYILLIIALFVRHFAPGEDFLIPRRLFGLSLLVMFIRYLQIFMPFKKLGITLIMIKEMVSLNLLMFLFEVAKGLQLLDIRWFVLFSLQMFNLSELLRSVKVITFNQTSFANVYLFKIKQQFSCKFKVHHSLSVSWQRGTPLL